MRIDGFGAGLLLIVGLAIPYLAWKTKQRFRGDELPMPRPQFFFQTAIFQLLIYGFALLAAWRNAILLRLLPATWWKAWPALVLLVVALLVLKLRWPSRDAADKRRLYAILPHDGRELGPYLVLCIVAAIAEEVIYRGVAFRLVVRLGATVWIAAAILSVVFALAHAVQGWRSTIAIGIIAAGFHFVVIYSGGLLPAIVAHFAYDAIAGIVMPRWVR
jgi:membrane protease YdiL (CAAX protease family)